MPSRFVPVYDPACGSGSLLLKVKRELGKNSDGLRFVGQEINLTTYNLCRMNMILHGVPVDDFSIAHGDTLIDPKHRGGAGGDFEEPFGAIVSNPPYSTKWKGDDDPTLIHDDRYAPAAVLAPKSRLTWRLRCICWRRWMRRVRRLSLSSRVCCTVAVRSVRFVSTC